MITVEQILATGDWILEFNEQFYNSNNSDFYLELYNDGMVEIYQLDKYYDKEVFFMGYPENMNELNLVIKMIRL